MGLIRMRAKVPFEFEGHHYRAGQPLSVVPIMAAALRYQGKADFVQSSTRAELAEEPEGEPVTAPDAPPDAPETHGTGSAGRRGSYRRRDLRAEGSPHSSKD